MRKALLWLNIFSVFGNLALAQGGADPATINKLPDYVLPSPDAAGLIKAQHIGVNYSSGSPNISIPLGSLTLKDFTLPINLSYNSTGLKMDEYASTIGMGWNLMYGGVISRAVFDRPDEMRTANNNAFTANFATQNQALLDFLSTANDKELDIFSISLPNLSAKFIIDANSQPSFLSNANCVLQVVNGSFLNGFVLTTDNGTQYYFLDAEISQNRNPSGTNCEKNFDNSPMITSWYLSKIVLPSLAKQINFSYITASVTSEMTISQTLSKVTASDQYSCGASPTGYACIPGTERFSTCVPTQVVTTKYISQVQTSDGDKIDFTYDPSSRFDIQGGKRLSSFAITNRNGWTVRRVYFNSSYQNTTTTSTTYRNSRLFLDNIVIRAVTTESATTKKMVYSFEYNDYGNLPARLTYAQDFYGYYNGKTTNPSLIPILGTGDINYTTFSNGTGGVSVTFGDRSVDTTFAIKGLLNKVIYPTGGYDMILYRPNRHVYSGVEKLCGGSSVSQVISYTSTGVKALEKLFIYRVGGTNVLSSLLLNDNIKFSQTNLVKKDGYTCSGVPLCFGLQCTYASVTSNTTIPLAALGAQHLYHTSVLEYEIGAATTNGLTEHKFTIFNGGNLDAHYLIGNFVLNTPYQIVPDVLIGENATNVYKYNGTSYNLLNAKQYLLSMSGLTNYSSYNVKKNYNYLCHSSPPGSMEFDPYDAEQCYINKFTVHLDGVTETDYSDPANPLVNTQTFQYSNPAYTYPTTITTIASDGRQNIVTKKYPPDYVSYNFMTARNIIAPVVEQANYINSTLLTTTTNTFSDWFSNSINIVVQSTEQKQGSSNQISKIVFSSYDNTDNVLELSKLDDDKISYIWDYFNDYPIAKVVNGQQSQIGYTSFEANGKGNWTFAGVPIVDYTSPTGYKCYNLATGNITRTLLTAANTYIVSYWRKGTPAYSIPGTISGYPVQGKTINGWTYFEHRVTGQTTITLTGTGFLDELRVYPSTAQMTTYTYEPQIGMTSQSDVNNKISYYEYDEMARVKLIRDQDLNIAKYFCYNYAGEPFDCNNIPNQFFNRPAMMTLPRTNCGVGFTGGSVTYVVPSAAYNSTISQADADLQAQNDVTANAQTYANTYGTCTPNPTCTSCTGNDKKCIASVCETGVKNYISSVQSGPHTWDCTYYYHWSDGTNSSNYVEQSPTPCAF